MQFTNKKGQNYFLHSTIVTLRGCNRKQQIFYFAKKNNPARACDMPSNYEIVENKRTGLPVLRKVG